MPIKKIIISLVFGLFSLFTYAQRCCQPSVAKDTINFYIENLKTTDIEYFNIPKRKIKGVNVSRENEYIITDYNNETLRIYLKQKYFKNLKFKDVLKTEILNSENIFYVNNILFSKDLFAALYLKDYSSIAFARTSTDIFEIRLNGED